jgi:2-phospho-L-lactate guanylyltransferase
MPCVGGDGDLWSLLVPVKLLDVAKSRLLVPAGVRIELALAMACDAVSAALACAAVGEVLVITDDERAGPALVALGARLVPDSPAAGLNQAVAYGAAAATCAQVAAMTSDLPALVASELDDLLTAAAAHPLAVVADAAGTGTTLLAAISAALLVPRFGVGSRAAHIEAGAVDLTAVAGKTVRHDVDTLESLREAVALGVGPATRRTLSGAAGAYLA